MFTREPSIHLKAGISDISFRCLNKPRSKYLFLREHELKNKVG